ncbi:MAG TPA: SCP-like extracellular, partial [Erythrobacter sp.]|nr:SCP-like extracellular [Erythrobacter sp.]
QVVWRDTQEVGCAVVTARGNDVLVCRYWPAGNVWGQKAY